MMRQSRHDRDPLQSLAELAKCPFREIGNGLLDEVRAEFSIPGSVPKLPSQAQLNANRTHFMQIIAAAMNVSDLYEYISHRCTIKQLPLAAGIAEPGLPTSRYAYDLSRTAYVPAHERAKFEKLQTFCWQEVRDFVSAMQTDPTPVIVVGIAQHLIADFIVGIRASESDAAVVALLTSLEDHFRNSRNLQRFLTISTFVASPEKVKRSSSEVWFSQSVVKDGLEFMDECGLFELSVDSSLNFVSGAEQGITFACPAKHFLMALFGKRDTLAIIEKAVRKLDLNGGQSLDINDRANVALLSLQKQSKMEIFSVCQEILQERIPDNWRVAVSGDSPEFETRIAEILYGTLLAATDTLRIIAQR